MVCNNNEFKYYKKHCNINEIKLCLLCIKFLINNNNTLGLYLKAFVVVTSI